MLLSDTTYYECRRSIERAGLAYRYLTETLSEDDASRLVGEVQPFSGWFPLETISVEQVVETSGDRWSNPAEEIRPLAEQACRRVWNKWDSTGDIPSSAEDWAMDLIAEYAEEDGLTLIEGERGEDFSEGGAGAADGEDCPSGV